jgi:hypothetical protein
MVEQALGSIDAAAAGDAYALYAAAHSELRAVDDGGEWDQAVGLSLGEESTAGGVNTVAQFAAFDRAVSDVVSRERGSAVSQLDAAADPLRALRVVVFLVGIVAAALVVIGYGQRLKEYR